MAFILPCSAPRREFQVILFYSKISKNITLGHLTSIFVISSQFKEPMKWIRTDGLNSDWMMLYFSNHIFQRKRNLIAKIKMIDIVLLVAIFGDTWYDGQTKDGQLQLHAHLTGSSFRGETISTMLEVGLTSFSLLASELLKTLQKEKELITRPDICKKEWRIQVILIPKLHIFIRKFHIRPSQFIWAIWWIGSWWWRS